MRRIDFIKQMAGMIALGWLPASTAGARTQGVELYQGWVAGYYYYDGPTVEKGLSTGQPLLLRREPDNRHDGKAIEVYAGKHKLGYILRKDNRILATLMDQQVPLEARIVEVHLEAPYEESVKVEVRMVRAI